MMKKVVVIGAGFGGLEAARRLGNKPVQVTLIDRKNHHTFQPLLYQVATAGLSPGEIAAPARRILRRYKNIEVLLGNVTGFNLEDSRVITDELRVPYDYLIVAAGATHSYFGHPEWEQFAPGLKSLDDALLIRRQVLLAFERAEHTGTMEIPSSPSSSPEVRTSGSRGRSCRCLCPYRCLRFCGCICLCG